MLACCTLAKVLYCGTGWSYGLGACSTEWQATAQGQPLHCLCTITLHGIGPCHLFMQRITIALQ